VVPASRVGLPVSDRLNRPVFGLGLNRRIFSGSCRPELRQNRSKPAAHPLPIPPGVMSLARAASAERRQRGRGGPAGASELHTDAADVVYVVKDLWGGTSARALPQPGKGLWRTTHNLGAHPLHAPLPVPTEDWGLESRPRRQQDWILKCLLGGRAHPLAACAVATLCSLREPKPELVTRLRPHRFTWSKRRSG
jgi:hypothetical protein